mmetsp:Transcript_80951/g.112428  ORF Transcript_80951/g.112428 Transcript_80951/m.112428 type:complete len:109 (+) Transcript_80951:56-382(+)
MSGGKMNLTFDRLDKVKAQQIMDTVGNGNEFEELPTFSELLEIFRKEEVMKGLQKEIPKLYDMLLFARENLLAQVMAFAKYDKYLAIAEVSTEGLRECFDYVNLGDDL